MADGEGEPRLLKGRVMVDYLFAHSGTDEEVAEYVKEVGEQAIEGIWRQHADLHLVSESVSVVELQPGDEIEIDN